MIFLLFGSGDDIPKNELEIESNCLESKYLWNNIHFGF